MFWAGILIGFSIGLSLGVIVMALAAVAGSAEQQCKKNCPFKEESDER